ncbi:TetR/AcrR family transcriptional regulator [Pseudotabrizicola alkalilacus]|uniref:TetR/AcrR family transcriptional regulator n=1 Tax=Pseudotabrizicola alkalilacus TaxID=2305252 RepID=A0A411YXR9_9RHOB|nr:TetR/AcrR family transcriptional regulator [Pseudotabrizicola alkalilacus]RGP35570.1 TetR/AcrR family transcriptional regulator [Pseudotabrizicola alkalilacus]
MSANSGSAQKPATRQTRNSQVTREQILTAAIEEFCEQGYAGANMTRIVQMAGCNIRMLYHYFENKDGLYLTALTRVYEELRRSERETSFWDMSPRDGVVALTHFTFDYMLQNPSFPKMILNENLNLGRAAAQVRETIFSTARPFLNSIETLLSRGHAEGEFTHRPSGLHLYLTILSLSFIHISNRHTLQATFDVDLGSDSFLNDRKAHATDVVLAYLTRAT